MFSSMLSLLGSLRGGSSFITNSLRFRSSASAYFTKTTGTATSTTTWTYSAWVKRGRLGAAQCIFSGGTSNTNNAAILFNADDSLAVYNFVGNAFKARRVSTAVYRDTSAWYNVVIAASGSTTLNVYVNGVQITSFSSSTAPDGSAWLFQSGTISIGSDAWTPTSLFDGYLTEVNFIDGQALTPASFGAIDSSTGVWAPRPYSGTYGTNGFYLKFADASAATAAAIGKDSSGNGNNWTPSGISVTAGATYDSMIDVPVNYSDGGNGRGNYAVLNPLSTQGLNTGITNGNLSVTLGTAAARGATGNMFVSSGKWYFEMIAIGSFAGDQVGIISESGAFTGGQVSQGVLYWSNGNKTVDAVNSAYGASYVAGDIIGVALDNDAGSVTFYKNNISQGAISIAARSYTAAICSASALSASGPFNINFGQRPFAYTPPAGFRALNTNNLPTPSIVNGANFMAATTYTGNAAARSLSNAVNNVSFQPDLVWIKSRTPGATNHALFDSVRGTTKYLSSNTTTAETTLAQSLTAFGADGFSLGTDTTLVNANANSYVAWQWKAGGAAVSNTQGTITSQVSANTTAGLSVVTYTGTGANATVGHGLGVAPKMIIVRHRNSVVADNWAVWHTAISASEALILNTTQGKTTYTCWNNTLPTSSVFSVGVNNDTNRSASVTYVAYCFAEIAGFSRFGSYTGNGLPDGPFVFCGFRPRFVMIKRTDSTSNWVILDTARNTFNVMNSALWSDLSSAEGAFTIIDSLSNGFKLRESTNGFNISGGTYIFAAFAENPSKYALAR